MYIIILNFDYVKPNKRFPKYIEQFYYAYKLQNYIEKEFQKCIKLIDINKKNLNDKNLSKMLRNRKIQAFPELLLI